ncbi:MAG: tetratricopeptide repeat protein [Myxococcota bacterium]
MRRLALILAVGLAGCPHARQPVPIGGEAPVPTTGIQIDTSVPVQDRVDEAADLIERGTPNDLARAVALLESAVGDDRNGIVRFDLGLAYQRRGELREAQKQYQSVIAVDPSNGAAWLGLGRVHELEGDSRAALSAYQTGVTNAPDNIDLRVAQVNALRRAGQADEAIAAARDALSTNAKSLALYNALGLAYLEKRNLVLARFVFQKATQEIEGAENNAVLQANIGWTYYLDDDKPAATEHLQKALELDPELVPALVQLARVYMDDHDYEDTVPLLERAATLDPNNADVQLTLGVAYRGVGRLDDAQAAYDRAMKLAPDDPAPLFNMGVLEGDYRKDYNGAIASFQKYIAANGQEKALAQEYVDAVEREKTDAEKKAKAEAERKARAEERARKEAMANEPAPDDGAMPADGGGEGDGDAVPPEPAPEAPPEDPGGDDGGSAPPPEEQP